jgi:integrase
VTFKEAGMRVEPFKDTKHIKNIKKLLAGNPRDRLLFTMGVNSGMRVQDLLGLRVKDVTGLTLGDSISVREKKTGKTNVIILNKEIMAALSDHLSAGQDGELFLFKSRKGKNYPITTFRVTKLVKSWADAVGAKGNYGAHSLRKTWTYQQRKSLVSRGRCWPSASTSRTTASPDGISAPPLRKSRKS